MPLETRCSAVHQTKGVMMLSAAQFVSAFLPRCFRTVIITGSTVMARHLRFIARTVMVQEGNVDAAYKNLNRVLTQDGIIDTVKRKRYYEKPCRERQRKNFENCRRIYHAEMARKIAFVSRTNREDPWLGC